MFLNEFPSNPTATAAERRTIRLESTIKNLNETIDENRLQLIQAQRSHTEERARFHLNIKQLQEQIKKLQRQKSQQDITSSRQREEYHDLSKKLELIKDKEVQLQQSTAVSNHLSETCESALVSLSLKSKQLNELKSNYNCAIEQINKLKKFQTRCNELQPYKEKHQVLVTVSEEQKIRLQILQASFDELKTNFNHVNHNYERCSADLEALKETHKELRIKYQEEISKNEVNIEKISNLQASEAALNEKLCFKGQLYEETLQRISALEAQHTRDEMQYQKLNEKHIDVLSHLEQFKVKHLEELNTLRNFHQKHRPRKCKNCRQTFTTASNTISSCTYHSGSFTKSSVTTGLAHWTCCHKRSEESLPCQLAGHHVESLVLGEED